MQPRTMSELLTPAPPGRMVQEPGMLPEVQAVYASATRVAGMVTTGSTPHWGRLEE
jgi:hypothetical protein